jgi:CDP-diacylglycerol--serine O-phosphatidyltransferase
VALKAVDHDQEPPRRPRRRRRRRGSGESRVSTFGNVLPQLLTTGNLAAGFYAIVKASSGDPVTASYAIFVAGIFDILDGRAARLTGSESRFGAEYDSIADTVSFGVAPAVIAFHAGGFFDLNWAGWVLAFTYTVCASLRLARYNVTSGKYRGRFDGLPSPAGAGMVVSTVWLQGFLQSSGFTFSIPPLIPALGLAGLGILMVSPIPYHSFKNVNSRDSYGAIVFFVILLVVLFLEPGLNFFLFGLVYTSHGPIALLWRKRTGRDLEHLMESGAEVFEPTDDTDDDEVDEQSEPEPELEGDR